MIALTSEKGDALRHFDPRATSPVGWYPRLGFVTENTARARNIVRQRGGRTEVAAAPLCQFRFDAGRPVAMKDCAISAVSQEKWQLDVAGRTFFLVSADGPAAFPIADQPALVPSKSQDWIMGFLMVLILGLGAWSAWRQPGSTKNNLEDNQKTVVVQNVQVAKPIPPPAPKPHPP